MRLTGRNAAGRLYGLTALCPIKIGTLNDRSYAWLTTDRLDELELNQNSPFASIPNTYFARLFILRDVFYESKPDREEHLKSQYLVFTSNLHGDLDTYLQGMWESQNDAVRSIWQYCVGFDNVNDVTSFIDYMRKCQVTNALLFNGSSDEPLKRQLKALLLKQEFGKFVADNQGRDPSELRARFRDFLAAVEVRNLDRPTWRPGAATLDDVVVG